MDASVWENGVLLREPPRCVRKGAAFCWLWPLEYLFGGHYAWLLTCLLFGVGKSVGSAGGRPRLRLRDGAVRRQHAHRGQDEGRLRGR